MELEVQRELELLPTLELVVPRKLEPRLELLPLELEAQQVLELPPTLELGVQRKLELWLEPHPLELEMLKPRLVELRG